MTRKRANLRWWVATLAALLGVALASSLGFWQLHRAAQKKQLQATMQAQAAAAVLDASAVRDVLAQSQAQLADLQHRPISLQGQWLAEHTVYLDNRQMHGKPGFFVLTPLQLVHGDVVLVQRGWIARNFQDRQALQPIATPPGTVQVEGRLAGAPARTYALVAGDAPDAHNPQIRQNLDLPTFAQTTGLLLWPVTVVQTDAAASEGLLRDWPEFSSGIATHHGYAFQWFAIAAVLAAMALWFQFLRPARTARQRHAAPSS